MDYELPEVLIELIRKLPPPIEVAKSIVNTSIEGVQPIKGPPIKFITRYSEQYVHTQNYHRAMEGV